MNSSQKIKKFFIPIEDIGHCSAVKGDQLWLLSKDTFSVYSINSSRKLYRKKMKNELVALYILKYSDLTCITDNAGYVFLVSNEKPDGIKSVLRKQISTSIQINSVCEAPEDPKLLICAGDDGFIYVLDHQTLEEVEKFEVCEDPLTVVTGDGEGNIWIGTNNGVLYCFDRCIVEKDEETTKGEKNKNKSSNNNNQSSSSSTSPSVQWNQKLCLYLDSGVSSLLPHSCFVYAGLSNGTVAVILNPNAAALHPSHPSRNNYYNNENNAFGDREGYNSKEERKNKPDNNSSSSSFSDEDFLLSVVRLSQRIRSSSSSPTSTRALSPVSYSLSPHSSPLTSPVSSPMSFSSSSSSTSSMITPTPTTTTIKAGAVTNLCVFGGYIVATSPPLVSFITALKPSSLSFPPPPLNITYEKTKDFDNYYYTNTLVNSSYLLSPSVFHLKINNSQFPASFSFVLPISSSPSASDYQTQQLKQIKELEREEKRRRMKEKDSITSIIPPPPPSITHPPYSLSASYSPPFPNPPMKYTDVGSPLNKAKSLTSSPVSSSPYSSPSLTYPNSSASSISSSLSLLYVLYTSGSGYGYSENDKTLPPPVKNSLSFDDYDWEREEEKRKEENHKERKENDGGVLLSKEEAVALLKLKLLKEELKEIKLNKDERSLKGEENEEEENEEGEEEKIQSEIEQTNSCLSSLPSKFCHSFSASVDERINVQLASSPSSFLHQCQEHRCNNQKYDKEIKKNIKEISSIDNKIELLKKEIEELKRKEEEEEIRRLEREINKKNQELEELKEIEEDLHENKETSDEETKKESEERDEEESEEESEEKGTEKTTNIKKCLKTEELLSSTSQLLVSLSYQSAKMQLIEDKFFVNIFFNSAKNEVKRK